MSILYKFFSWIMQFCCTISFNYYILALFFFALIIQVILFPLGIKQQKSSIKMAKMRPQERGIRKKYEGRKDKVSQQKMQQEIQELYKKENYSMFSGCLPLLIQFPIIIVLFAIVRQPLTYNTNLAESDPDYKDKTKLEVLYDKANEIADLQKSLISDAREITGDKNAYEDEYKKAQNYKDRLLNNNDRELALADMIYRGASDFYEVYEEASAKGEMKLVTLDDIKGKNDNYEMSDPFSVYGKENKTGLYSLYASKLTTMSADAEASLTFKEQLAKYGVDKDNLPNFVFIGKNTLLETPSFTKLDWLMLVPLLVFISSWFSGMVTRKLSVQPLGPNGKPQNQSAFMTWGLPLMSTFFSFQFSAAVGMYWVYRSLVAALQQYILSKMFPIPVITDEQVAAAEAELRKKKKKKKVLLIEVDEDDDTYNDIAITEERAEKIRKKQEKAKKAAEEKKNAAEDPADDDDDKTVESMIEKAPLKDDDDKQKKG